VKIYFSPCGLGLGHVSRCIEIAKEIKREIDNVEILFSSYLDSVQLVRAEGYKLVEAPKFYYWTWPDGTVDPWRTLKWLSGKLLAYFASQVKFEVEQLKSFNPDLIVSDTRLSSVIAGKILGKPVITMLNQFHLIAPGLIHYPKLQKFSDIFSFSCLAPGWGLSDEILIPDFPPPRTVSTYNLRVPSFIQNLKKLSYVGPILPVKPESLPGQKEIKAKLGLKVKEPLVYASASGPTNERLWLGGKLLKIFSNMDGNYNYQVIISLGRKNMESFVEHNGKLRVYGWIPNRFEVLKACDLLVARSAHGTITQALTYGKPMLLIPTQEQTEQIHNARTAIRLGVAKAIDQRWLSKSHIQPLIRELLENKSYKMKAEKMAKYARKFNGIKTAVKKILSYL
jgi:UDP:flavonoid glycosyltransferase YjiC (YdhE family)